MPMTDGARPAPYWWSIARPRPLHDYLDSRTPTAQIRHWPTRDPDFPHTRHPLQAALDDPDDHDRHRQTHPRRGRRTRDSSAKPLLVPPALTTWPDSRTKATTPITGAKATRPMSLRRLANVGLLYQLRPSKPLAPAGRRIACDPDLAVDPAGLAATQVGPLRPAARWAQDDLRAGGPSIRGLGPVDLARLADRCRLSIAHLIIFLSTEVPVHP